jgi:peptidoglycan LD-endopeptidase CwlK
MFKFSSRSLQALQGVDPALVAICHRALALTTVDFVITEGVRTRERQQQLVAQGASKTLNSRHLTGHAIDFAPLVSGRVSWDHAHFIPVADAFKKAAAELNTPIVWGGDWRWRDSTHIELKR